jgi:signal transduction histidine kinase
MSPRVPQFLHGVLFVASYVALDWASYLHPLYGLNITPWNPSLALGLVYWFHLGRIAAVPWFVAILISEVLVRDLPANLPITLILGGVLTLGYGGMAEALRRYAPGTVLADRRRLLFWLLIVLAGTLLTSCAYISLLSLYGLVPVGAWTVAMARFWIGDCVGIVVTMPFFWLLFDGQKRLHGLLRRWETAAYVLLAGASLWLSFGLGGVGEFQYFYLLFLPLVWAAARQGVPGAALAAFSLQAGIIFAVQLQNMVAVTVFELQTLGAVLAVVGLFIGVVVDEKKRASDELRQSLRLAAAGEMAAALAHELNQPLTALSAYGAACEQLLDRGETGERLRDTIKRVVTEAQRAGDVVRRLRDFFRTGATRLEQVSVGDLLAATAAQFADRSRRDGVTLLVELAPEKTLLVYRLQIEIVMRNLVANAFEAVVNLAPARREVRLRAQAEGTRRICIFVEDSGPGPSRDSAATLFQPFQSTKSSGLGLGLAISRVIAEAHGGSLSSEMADHGVFKLVLPTEGGIGDAS